VSLVIGSEVIHGIQDVAGCRNLYDAIAIAIGVGAWVVCAEAAVAGLEKQVPGRIHRGRLSALPDSVKAAIWIRAEDVHRSERRPMKSTKPAMVGSMVAVRGEGNVDDSVEQDQARTIHLPKRVELESASRAAVAGSGNGWPRYVSPCPDGVGDDDRPA